MRKKLLILGSLILAVVASYVAYRIESHKPVLPAPEPEYKNVTSYDDGNYSYSCSKPLRAKLQPIPGPYDPNNPKVYKSYIPVNHDEAKLFCHSTAVIENEGKLKVLQKPEVKSLIGKYQYKEVSIKALEFKYIKDADFVDRILPAYKDRDIGCIIVLDTPGEDKVFLEDEKLDTFEELNYQTFDSYLQKASPADRKLFYDNLK